MQQYAKKVEKNTLESQAHSANDLHLFNADADCRLKVELNALFYCMKQSKKAFFAHNRHQKLLKLLDKMK